MLVKELIEYLQNRVKLDPAIADLPLYYPIKYDKCIPLEQEDINFGLISDYDFLLYKVKDVETLSKRLDEEVQEGGFDEEYPPLKSILIGWYQ